MQLATYLWSTELPRKTKKNDCNVIEHKWLQDVLPLSVSLLVMTLQLTMLSSCLLKAVKFSYITSILNRVLECMECVPVGYLDSNSPYYKSLIHTYVLYTTAWILVMQFLSDGKHDEFIYCVLGKLIS